MTHRGGLAYGFTSKGPIGKAHEDRYGPAAARQPAWTGRMAQASRSLPLSFPPGERLHYSHSTDVLGFLVGRVAGMSYREFIMQRILKPLGMNDTDFHIPPAEARPRGGDVPAGSGDGRSQTRAVPAI